MSSDDIQACPGRVHAVVKLRPSLIGQYVIINEFDKPCTRLIAQVERIEGETVVARYITRATRLTHCSAHISEVTPIWKFGVTFDIKGGYITAVQIAQSKDVPTKLEMEKAEHLG